LEKVVDVLFEPWIFSNKKVQKFSVFSKLSFQVPDVPQVDIILESVDVHTLGESEFIVAKEMVDP